MGMRGCLLCEVLKQIEINPKKATPKTKPLGEQLLCAREDFCYWL